MRIHSTIITTLAIAAVSGAPAGALGSPLLSGYGGPGTGEQQLVGGGLVGSGGSGGGLAGESSPSGSSSAAVGQTASKAGGSRSPRATGASGGAPNEASGSGARRAASSSKGPAHAVRSTVASTTLGLSDGELVLVALIALILLAAAVLTRWLVGLERRGVSADRRSMNLGRGH